MKLTTAILKQIIKEELSKVLSEDDAAAESAPAMSLEEAAPWDKEALKRRYPRDHRRHAIIDQEHGYGTRFDDVMKKLDHRPGASTRPNQGRWGY
jgi:hypothetical protein